MLLLNKTSPKDIGNEERNVSSNDLYDDDDDMNFGYHSYFNLFITNSIFGFNSVALLKALIALVKSCSLRYKFPKVKYPIKFY